MTDAEFKKLVAEIMDYTDRHSKSKTYYRNAGYRKLEARWPKGCRDCGCTEPEFYMARNDLWIKAGRIGSRHGRLCVSCFERRLGRPVSDGDLGPDGITTEDHEGMTVSEWRTKAGNP